MDRAIFYTSSARLFQGVGGVVSVLLVASFLTGIEQGFYYTFGSILAIQVFFELGLGGIISQFVAHEKAHLVEQDNALSGPESYRSRLTYLLHFCIKWYAVLAVALFVVTLVAGFTFFSYFYDSAEPVAWQIPWLLLVIGTTLNFILVPISSFIEGLGKVKEIAFIRLLQQVITQALVWGGLAVGFKLYAASYVSIVSAVIFVVYVWRKFYLLLHTIYHTRIEEKVSYRHEIFPFQWRISVSWISGYFISQLFNPVLFATEGAVVAGQMGMTLTALTAIQNFTMSWISTKVPTMSQLIAQKNYTTLDHLFGRTLRQSMAINWVALCLFFVLIFVLRSFHIELCGKLLDERFLPYVPMLLMALTVAINQYAFSVASYVRCHKKEPYMWQAISMGAACVVSTLVLGKLYGVMGITVGYAVLTVLSGIWIRAIYIQKKKLWHNE